MTINKTFVRCIWCLLTLGLALGCSPVVNPTDLHPTRTYIESFTTKTPTKSPTLTPSGTISIPTLTNTQTFKPSITPTKMPTLLPDDAMEFVLNLLENNGECKLPCWWGRVYPGKTQWNEVRKYLETFATEIYLAGKEGDILLYGVNFRVPQSVRYYELLEVSIDVQDGLVLQIFIGQPYPVEKILNDMGKPSEIWINAISSNTASQDGRYSLALFWPDKGVLAVYDGTTRKTNPIEICLDKIDRTTTSLWLWDANQQREFLQIGGDLLIGSPPYQRDFYQLEIATEIDIDIFYEEYGKLGNSFCFNMPDPDLP